MERSDFHHQLVDATLVMLEGWAGDSNHWPFDVMWTLVQDAPEVAWPLLIELADQADDVQLGSLGAGFLEDFIATHGRQFIDRIEQRAASHPRFRLALQNVFRQGGPTDIWKRIVPLLDGRPDGVEGLATEKRWVSVSVAGLPPGSTNSAEAEHRRKRILLRGDSRSGRSSPSRRVFHRCRRLMERSRPAGRPSFNA
jgi:hypothetical protein